MADQPTGEQGSHAYSVESAWRNGAWVWDAVYGHTAWGQYYTLNALRHVRRSLESHRVRTVLDVGAGTGRFAIPLHDSGYAVTAIDLDGRALLQLSARQSGIRTVQGDFGDLDLGTFDMIVSIGTVKYLRSFQAFLDKSYRSLSPGGVLLCEMLNPSNARTVLKRGLSGQSRQDPSFPTELTPRACRQALLSSGFRAEWIRGSCLLLPGYTSRTLTLFKFGGLMETVLLLDRLPSLSAQYYFAATRRG